jgi:hypothetical protein
MSWNDYVDGCTPTVTLQADKTHKIQFPDATNGKVTGFQIFAATNPSPAPLKGPGQGVPGNWTQIAGSPTSVPRNYPSVPAAGARPTSRPTAASGQLTAPPRSYNQGLGELQRLKTPVVVDGVTRYYYFTWCIAQFDANDYGLGADWLQAALSLYFQNASGWIVQCGILPVEVPGTDNTAFLRIYSQNIASPIGSGGWSEWVDSPSGGYMAAHLDARQVYAPGASDYLYLTLSHEVTGHPLFTFRDEYNLSTSVENSFYHGVMGGFGTLPTNDEIYWGKRFLQGTAVGPWTADVYYDGQSAEQSMRPSTPSLVPPGFTAFGNARFDVIDPVIYSSTPGIPTYYVVRPILADGSVGSFGDVGVGAAPPANAPTATTSSATSIATTQATFGGVVNPNAAATTYQFEYGKTTALGTTIPVSGTPVGSGTNNISVSLVVTGLEPNTLYRYRIKANSAAGTSTGTILSFTTLAAAPSVTTLPVKTVTPTTAFVGASINPQNSPTTFKFQIGTTTAYGLDSPVITAAVAAQYGYTFTTLTPNTVYHYRIVATNSAGTSTGADAQFTTPALADTTAPVISIVTGPADGATITVSNATFGFSSTESGTTFEVRVNGGAWVPRGTVPNYTTPALANGTHTFEVRGTDTSGNVSAPELRTFVIALPVTPGTGTGGGVTPGTIIPPSVAPDSQTVDGVEVINSIPIPKPPPFVSFTAEPAGQVVSISTAYGTYVWGDEDGLPAARYHPINRFMILTGEVRASPFNYDIVEWEWDFGDGTFATGPVVGKTYTVANPNVVVHLRVTTSEGHRSYASMAMMLTDERGVRTGTTYQEQDANLGTYADANAAFTDYGSQTQG